MAFGNKVTDFSQAAIGYFGYTLKLDVTGLLFHTIKAVQAQKGPNDTYQPVTSEVSIEILQKYLNDNTCPRLAFNFSDGQATVFFKGTGANIPARANDTSYAVGDVVLNAAADGAFRCITAGISASVEPTMSTTANTTDGTVVWEYVCAVPIADSFPYVAATRYALFGVRKAQNCTVDGDQVDAPEKDLKLVLAYAKEYAWSMVKNKVPEDLAEIIKNEESRVRQD